MLITQTIFFIYFRTNYALMSQWMGPKPQRDMLMQSAVYGKRLQQNDANPYVDVPGQSPRDFGPKDFAAAAAVRNMN